MKINIQAVTYSMPVTKRQGAYKTGGISILHAQEEYIEQHNINIYKLYINIIYIHIIYKYKIYINIIYYKL